ncbi:MAG: FAD binding domain-containing protein, partial [Anaerolineae bacterium]
EQATILAGGTDLGLKFHNRELVPGALVYVGHLGLDYIKEEGDTLVIAAAATIEDIATSSLVGDKAPIVAQAAREHSSPPIRNAATIGGNVANASPAADMATPLLVLDAELVLASQGGERVVPVGEFFTGPHETVRAPDELMTEVRIPAVDGQAAFIKLGRRKAHTLSVANAAARVVMDDAKCVDVRIAAGAVGPTPIRCLKAEEMLRGEDLTAELIAEAASEAVGECDPVDDERATAWYRRRVIKVLIERALKQASGL